MLKLAPGPRSNPTRLRRTTPVSPAFPAGEAPKPFLKWVGGKRQLLSHLRAFTPDRFATYHEPFLGGGALFFELQPERAVLSDTNERLVRAYRGVRNDVDDVIALLQRYPHDKDFFLQLREVDIDAATDAEVAAWMIYLNRTGYNGLYRVNRQNRFNVPFGDYANPTICDVSNLHACSRALRRAEILHAPFDHTMARVGPDDFVYFDPPYIPLSTTSNFTSYTCTGFDMDDQIRLRDVARDLKHRGASVVLSNSSAPAVYDLYKGDFEIVPALAARAINCKAESRGKIFELIIH
jgi:DNA adenine methylase